MATTTIQTAGVFSGYTLSELRAITLRILRQSDTSRYSPTAGTADYDWIDDALNRGMEDFARRTTCLRSYAVIELKANYRTYRLPADFLDMYALYLYDSSNSNGYAEITFTTMEELNNSVDNWRTDTGTPTHAYRDRVYGNNEMIGLYPIPDTDGGTITFDTEYGSVVEWVCPIYTFNQEYGSVIRMTDTDEFFLNTDAGVSARVLEMNGNLWMEYYKLPMNMTSSAQYPEIPKEYQKALPYYAAWDLLQHNPEDSAEFKRAASYEARFNNEIKTYIFKRKQPLKLQNLRGQAAAWGALNSFNWYSGMP